MRTNPLTAQGEIVGTVSYMSPEQAEGKNVDARSDVNNAGVPVEMHLYAEGKHAFGLRPTKFPITRWPQLVETWLRTIGMLSE